MRKIWLIICFAVLTAVLHAQWWDEGNFDWEKSEELVPGIEYAHLEKDQPRLMKIWVMRVDLSKNFTFHTAKKAKNYGEIVPTHKHRNLKIHTLRQTSTDFMMEHRKNGIDMVAAVNAAPWSPWDNIYSPYASNLGLLINDGELISPVLKGRPSFVVYKDGKVDLRIFDEKDKLDDVRIAVTGFGFALKGGKVLTSGKSLAPRTGFGLSEDHRYLYLVVIDGRQPGFSMGCTVQEVGFLLKYFGSFDGVNMDGGGSSSFVVLDGDKAKMLNHQPKGAVRAVGASLGISKPEK